MIPRAARTVLKVLGGAAIAAVLPLAGLRWFEHQQKKHQLRTYKIHLFCCKTNIVDTFAC
jgi:hypothetical protein